MFLDNFATSIKLRLLSANGRFKNVKRVVVDYDNYNGNVGGNTNEPSEWNLAPSLVYNRRIKFYSC